MRDLARRLHLRRPPSPHTAKSSARICGNLGSVTYLKALPRYEHEEDLSLQQAQRDLRDLVAEEILAPVGRTRARFYKPGAEFPERALQIANSPVVRADPYAG